MQRNDQSSRVHRTEDEETFRRIDVAAIIDGAQVLLDDGAYRILSLNNASAAAWWGRGTRWCTAGSGWFAGYRQYGELIYLEHRPKGRRWQLYFRSTGIRSLPEGLKVGGDLLLSAQATPTLPADLEVGGGILCCIRWGAVDRPVTAALHAGRIIDE